MVDETFANVMDSIIAVVGFVAFYWEIKSINAETSDVKHENPKFLSFERNLEDCQSNELMRDIQEAEDATPPAGITGLYFAQDPSLWLISIMEKFPLFTMCGCWAYVSYRIQYHYLGTRLTPAIEISNSVALALGLILDAMLITLFGVYLGRRAAVYDTLTTLQGRYTDVTILVGQMKMTPEENFQAYKYLLCSHYLTFNDLGQFDDIQGLAECGMLTQDEADKIANPLYPKKRELMTAMAMDYIIPRANMNEPTISATHLRQKFIGEMFKIRGDQDNIFNQLARCPPPTFEFMSYFCGYFYILLFPFYAWDVFDHSYISIIMKCFVNFILYIFFNEAMILIKDYHLLDLTGNEGEWWDCSSFNPDANVLSSEVSVLVQLFFSLESGRKSEVADARASFRASGRSDRRA